MAPPPPSDPAKIQQIQQFLTSVLSQRGPSALPYAETTKWLIRQHLLTLISSHSSLEPKTATFTHNDGRSAILLQADGTIPMPFQGVSYNIPVVIWLLESYPRDPPRVYVNPTRDMIIKRPHSNVSPSGLVSLPYLHAWVYPSSNLLDLASQLSAAFSRDPPLYSQRRPQSSGSGYARPSPSPSIGSGYSRPSPSPPIGSGYARPPPPSYQQQQRTDDAAEVYKRNAINKLVEMIHVDLVVMRSAREAEAEGLLSLQANLKRREEDLNNGLQEMAREKETLEQELQVISMNTDVLDSWVRDNQGKSNSLLADLDVDSAFVCKETMSKQMLELESVPFDIRSILDDVLSLFSEESRNKGIELAVFVSDKVPEIVKGDSGRFRQIIINLVGNSVKFTEKGHIFVKVHLAEQSKDGAESKPALNGGVASEDITAASKPSSYNTLSGYEAADGRNSWDSFKHLLSSEELLTSSEFEASSNVRLMVSIEDTGIGIPLTAQGRVFMPFMQADSSTSRTYGGTGIGLSISKCLVELMRGQISFVSRPRVGSTFWFTAVFERCDKCSLKKPTVENLPSSFRGMRAIVVDAKPVRAAVTRYHMKRLGISVDVMTSLRTAVSTASGRNGSPLPSGTTKLDMILVEKDSWISTEDIDAEIRQMNSRTNGNVHRKTPKLALFATNITNSEFDRAKSAGFADTVIMKPLRASMIGACLQQVLELRKARQQHPEGSSPATLKSLLTGKKILVVDDNMVNRRVAAGALKKFGAEVVCAESGQVALGLLQIPHSFDACFMDIQMPQMDGFEATRQIRMMEKEAKEKTKLEWHLPILAMTADVIHATYEECLKSGMDGYVSKPFEEENLYKSVAKSFKANPISDSSCSQS